MKNGQKKEYLAKTCQPSENNNYFMAVISPASAPPFTFSTNYPLYYLFT